MSGGRLLRHYDHKYAEEAERATPAGPVVPVRRHPRDRFEACLAHFPPRFRGGSILELGAGDGRVLRGLISAGVPFDAYTASDFAGARLAGMLASLDDPRVRVAELDADALGDAERGPFDAVIMIALIEHLIDPIGALRAVRERLRPGGILYLDTPNIAKWSRRLKLLTGSFPATASVEEGVTTFDGRPVDLHDEGHLHYFTYRSLSRLLVEQCGFSRVEKLAYATAPRPLGVAASDALARWWPELFSELAVVAHA